MLPFSRQKKISKDVSNGLVFGWRGGHKGGLFWFLSSIIVAAFLFALFSIVSLDFRSRARTQKFSSEVVLLSRSHPLSLKGDRVSPFPSKWDPYDASESTSRIRSEMLNELKLSERSPAIWKPQPVASSLSLLPSVFQRGALWLPRNVKIEREMTTKSVRSIKAIFNGDAFVSSRIEQKNAIYPNKFSPEWYGVELRWLVGIDSKGNLEQCMLLDRMTGGESETIEKWLRGIKFNQGVRGVGQLILTLEAEL